MVNGVGVGSGVGLVSWPGSDDGLQFGFLRKAGRVVARTARGAARGAGRAASKAGRTVKRGATKLAKKAVAYAPSVLAAAAGEGAAALCAAYGVPPAICRQGGQALGKAVGKGLAKAAGIPPKDLPVDPSAIMKGDPKALMVLGRTLAAEAGLPLPKKEDAIAFASKRLKLPPALVKSATMQAENMLAQQMAKKGGVL